MHHVQAGPAIVRAAAFALLIAPGIAMAQGMPQPLKVDQHSFEVPYNPDQTYPVTMQYGLQCVVQIAPTEQMLYTIFNPGSPVESLNPQDQRQDDPLINSVPLVGAQPGGPVSVTIIAKDVTGRQHVYPLLVTVLKPPPADARNPGQIAPGVCLKMKFTYTPQQLADISPAGPRKPSWKEQQAAKAAAVAKARLNVDPFYGPQNDDYRFSGRDRDIAPRYSPHDNGTVTLFPYVGPAPTVLLVESHGMPNICKGLKPSAEELHGHEEALNQDKYLDQVLVHATGWHFRLRENSTSAPNTRGKVLEVWNCGYNPQPDPGTGTDSTDVVRRVITER
jgi:hypothetical protein